MEGKIIEVKENHGNGKIKVKVFSQETLTDAQVKYISSLTRDEALKYGPLHGWKVVDASDWAE